MQRRNQERSHASLVLGCARSAFPHRVLGAQRLRGCANDLPSLASLQRTVLLSEVGIWRRMFSHLPRFRTSSESCVPGSHSVCRSCSLRSSRKRLVHTRRCNLPTAVMNAEFRGAADERLAHLGPQLHSRSANVPLPEPSSGRFKSPNVDREMRVSPVVRGYSMHRLLGHT